MGRYDPRHGPAPVNQRNLSSNTRSAVDFEENIVKSIKRPNAHDATCRTAAAKQFVMKKAVLVDRHINRQSDETSPGARASRSGRHESAGFLRLHPQGTCMAPAVPDPAAVLRLPHWSPPIHLHQSASQTMSRADATYRNQVGRWFHAGPVQAGYGLELVLQCDSFDADADGREIRGRNRDDDAWRCDHANGHAIEDLHQHGCAAATRPRGNAALQTAAPRPGQSVPGATASLLERETASTGRTPIEVHHTY